LSRSLTASFSTYSSVREKRRSARADQFGRRAGFFGGLAKRFRPLAEPLGGLAEALGGLAGRFRQLAEEPGGLAE